MRQPTQFAEYEFILRVLHIVLSFKYRILLVAVFVTSLSVGVSLLLSEKYSASSVFGFNLNQNRGGVKPGDFRGSSTVSVLEYEMIIDQIPDDERDRHLARLKSHEFLSLVIEKFELLPILFESDWDKERNNFKEDKAPNIITAVKLFRDSVLSIGKYDGTELMSIKITTGEPRLSQELANAIPALYNNYNMKRELSELDQRRGFLEKRLTELKSREAQQSVYRLLESQMAVESLLFARSNYPLEIIMPATLPLFKSSPQRKLWAVLGFVLSVVLSVLFVMGRTIFSAFLSDFRAFSSDDKEKKSESKQPSSDDSMGEEWVDDVR